MCSQFQYLVTIDVPENHSVYFATGDVNDGGQWSPQTPLGPPFVTHESNNTNSRVILNPIYYPYGSQVVYLCDNDTAEGGAISMLAGDSDACAGTIGGGPGGFPDDGGDPIEEPDAGLDEYDEQSGDIDNRDDDSVDVENNSDSTGNADDEDSWLDPSTLWVGGGLVFGALFILGSIKASSSRRATSEEEARLKNKAARGSGSSSSSGRGSVDGGRGLPSSPSHLTAVTAASARTSSFMSMDSGVSGVTISNSLEFRPAFEDE